MTKESLLKNFKDIDGIIDFWAPWCGPCLALSPIIDDVAKQSKVKLIKVNIQEDEDIASEFQISSIPTVVIIKKGKMVEEIIGSRSKETYLKAIQ